MEPARVCPQCGLANCPSVLLGVTCGPPVERRVQGPRRRLERRVFARPEGRRRGGGRRQDDPSE